MATVSGVQACESYYEQLASQRVALPFDIDGIVFKVNNIAQQELLGFVSGRPGGPLRESFPPRR